MEIAGLLNEKSKYLPHLQKLGEKSVFNFNQLVR